MIVNLSSIITVGITQRIDFIDRRSELRDALDQRFSKWLVHSGFLPVVIPNTLSDLKDIREPMLKNWLQTVRPGALVLSGGNDIGEYPERDATEHYLLSWAEEKRVPVIGICRGMQMMTVWAGGKLIKQKGHAGSRHKLMVPVKKDEWPANVNSYHNWGLGFCPDGFEVLAHAEDGVIEAIKHTRLPWEGWMWHPEREVPFSLQDINRLKMLFHAQ